MISPRKGNRAVRYAVAPIAVAMAIFCRAALNPVLHNASLSLFFIVAILVSGWLGGLGSGLLAIVLSVLAIDYLFLPPVGSLGPVDLQQTVQLLSFLILGTLINLIIVRMRREQRRAEQIADGARTNEFRYRATYEHADVGIERLDEHGRLMEGNPALCRMLGYTSDELSGRTFIEITHPDDLAEESRLLTQLKRREISSYKMEKRYLRKDGQPIWVRVTSSLAPAGAGFYRISVIEDISERKGAEQALRESAKRFRSMADSLPQLAWIAQPDGFIFWYNQRWYEYTGTTPEQMEGWGWQSVHDPQTLPAVLERWKASIATGEPLDMVFPLRGNDGRFRRFLTRVMPLKDDQGRVVQWFGTNTDVDELKRTEEALRESQQRLSMAQKAARIGSFEWNIQSGINVWSPELEAMYGLKPGEFGRTQTAWEQLVYPEDRQAGIGVINRAFETGLPSEGEWRVQWRDGSVHWIYGRFQVLKDEAGKPLRLAGVNIDITERKQSEERLREAERLRESEQRLADIINFLPDATFALDNAGRIIAWNKAMENLTDAPAGEVLGKGNHEYALRLYGKRIPCLADVVLSGGATEWSYPNLIREGDVIKAETYIPHLKPGGVWLSIRVAPIYDAQGNAVGVIDSCQDITGHKRAEEELHEAYRTQEALNAQLQVSNSALQDFAVIASHDLQEPLRKIMTYGDKLRRKHGEALPEEAKDYLERIMAATGRMQSLIDDLLTYSRVTTKAQPFMPVDLGQVLAEVLEDLESRIGAMGAKVEARKLPTIEADPTQMRQFLQNLIGNALKFTPPGVAPFVRIYSHPPANGSVQILVEDHGIGFDEKYLDRIFNVFQRLEGRSAYEGTGMGLAICRKIAERHGGSITARSRPNEGSTFMVTLPLSQRRREAARHAA